MFMDTPPDAFFVLGGFFPKSRTFKEKCQTTLQYQLLVKGGCKRNSAKRFEIGFNIALSLQKFWSFKTF